MYTFHANRNDFIEILFQKRSISPERVYEQHFYLNEGEILLCWEDDDRPVSGAERLPQIIIVNDSEIKDFLAWTSTFFPGFNPLSAYFRVMCLSDFENIFEKNERDFEWKRHINKVRQSKGGNDIVWDALIGMVIGETYSLAYANSNSPVRLTSFNCATSFSFLLSRCIACGYKMPIWLETFNRWQKLRTFFGLRPSPLSTDEISFVANILDLVIGNEDFNSRQEEHLHPIRKLIKLGFATNEALSFFDSNFSTSISTSKFITLPKEDRFKIANEYLNAKKHTDIWDAFNAAYIINLISPGSFEQKNMFSEFSNLNFIMLLYGLCAGLTGDKKIRESFSYLGNRIYRDITRRENLFSTPRCDCSYAEITALYNNKDDFFKLNNYSRVLIEIFPNVEITMSNSTQDSKLPKQELLPSLAQNEPDITIFYNYLGNLINNAIEMRHYISGEGDEINMSKKRQTKKSKKSM